MEAADELPETSRLVSQFVMTRVICDTQLCESTHNSWSLFPQWGLTETLCCCKRAELQTVRVNADVGSVTDVSVTGAEEKTSVLVPQYIRILTLHFGFLPISCVCERLMCVKESERIKVVFLLVSS